MTDGYSPWSKFNAQGWSKLDARRQAWASYRLMRWLLGHRKIYGVWFRPGELDRLLDRLELREKNGTILHARDVNLLDRYRPDRRIHLKRMGDADFVSW